MELLLCPFRNSDRFEILLTFFLHRRHFHSYEREHWDASAIFYVEYEEFVRFEMLCSEDERCFIGPKKTVNNRPCIRRMSLVDSK